LVGPPNLIRELPKIRRLIDRQGDLAMEGAIADLIQEGVIRRYLKKALKQYRRRRDHCVDLFQKELTGYLHFNVPAGGLALWAKFHPGVRLPELSAQLKKQGVYLSDGLFYAPEENAVRMGFGAMTEPEMVRATIILQRTIRSAFPIFARN
ncbi:MAG: PLP-dependent aminotransferase family protein, partial [Sinomicrobium sp.]|nr:PLP-dependent aminotransferase family protein [Sinomicrobium sp.]